MQAAKPMEVRVVDDFASLAGEWEKLHASSQSIFTSFDWLALWWKHYGKGRPLKILCARTGGALVGILPLYIDTAPMLRFPVRQLRLVGTGGDTFPDDLGPILLLGHENEAARALADAVLELPGWDVLLLHDLDPACAFTQAMSQAAKRAHLPSLEGRSERIAFMNLAASWDDYLKSLHRDKRYRIKNIRKKLNAAHPSHFFVWSDAATLDQGFDRLVFLHRKRWDQAGLSHAFVSPEYLGFHRDVMHACLKKDRLRLYCLEIDGQVGAMYYFYKLRDRVFLMQSGFDPDLSDVKPGQVLLGHVIEHAISEGHKVLDFLRGEHRYKDELATGERETVYLTAFRFRPGSLVWAARKLYLPQIKAWVMARLKPKETPPSA